jgi:hypothetical protein
LLKLNKFNLPSKKQNSQLRFPWLAVSIQNKT